MGFVVPHHPPGRIHIATFICSLLWGVDGGRHGPACVPMPLSDGPTAPWTLKYYPHFTAEEAGQGRV